MDSFIARNAFAITPDDTAALNPIPQKVYVGGAGNITCRLRGDSADVVFNGVPVGTVLPIEAQYVRATGTTATLLRGLIG